LNAADQGIQAGYALLKTPATNPAADPNQDAMGPGQVAGYYSSASTTEPNWSDPTVWQKADRPAVKLNGGAPDAAGNVVWFMVERLCTVANCKVNEKCGVDNLCGSTPGSSILSRE